MNQYDMLFEQAHTQAHVTRDYVERQQVYPNQLGIVDAGVGGGGTIKFATKIGMDQIKGLVERLENIEKVFSNRLESVEKKVFGEYYVQRMIKKHDASMDFENDVEDFFQYKNLAASNRKAWHKIFKELNFDVSAEELLRISNKYQSPEKNDFKEE